MQVDGELGPKRLLQTICLYFTVRAPAMQKYIDTFFKTLYDQGTFTDEFIIGW